MKTVILINGVIGVGKTTLGKIVAERLNAGFVDRDDFRDRTKSWITDNRKTITRVIEASKSLLLLTNSVVLIAPPLRYYDWVIYENQFAELGCRCFCLTLTADLSNIIKPDRNRSLQPAEIERSRQMIGEGYDKRPFSDAFIRTDHHCFDKTADQIEKHLQMHFLNSDAE